MLRNSGAQTLTAEAMSQMQSSGARLLGGWQGGHEADREHRCVFLFAREDRQTLSLE